MSKSLIVYQMSLLIMNTYNEKCETDPTQSCNLFCRLNDEPSIWSPCTRQVACSSSSLEYRMVYKEAKDATNPLINFYTRFN